MAPFDYLRNDLHLTLAFDEQGHVRVQAQRESYLFTATLSLDKRTVDALAADYVHGAIAKAGEIAVTLIRALEAAGVAFQPWLDNDQPEVIRYWDPQDPVDSRKATYSLLRLVLHLDAPELIALPWEAMTDVWAQAGHNTLVVRMVSQPLDMASIPLDLPLTILKIDQAPTTMARSSTEIRDHEISPQPAPESRQPGTFQLEKEIQAIFGHIDQADVDDIVRMHSVGSWTEVSEELNQRIVKTDIVHISVTQASQEVSLRQQYPSESPMSFILSIVNDAVNQTTEPPTVAFRSGELFDEVELSAWLKAHQTRLVVLDVLDREVRSRLLGFASNLAANGGPAVVVACFGKDEELRQAFFRHYYGQIIHDVPLDHACFVNWTSFDELFRPPPEMQPPWQRNGLVHLVVGPGSEVLLRITPVLYRVEAQRHELEQRASRFHSEGVYLADQLQLLARSGAKGFDRDSGRPALASQLYARARDFANASSELAAMSQQMSFMPTSERRSTAPLVRNRRELEDKAAALAESGQVFRQASVDPALNYLDQNLKRTVNTWLVDGKSAEYGRVLAPQDRLRVNAPYLLYVDIGPRTVATRSIVVNPVELQDVVEQIFEIEDAEGVMLEVAVFSDDFWVGPAQVDPPVKPEEWRCPPAEWPQPAITWQRPVANAAVDHIWLARARPSPPLHFSLRPRHAGYGRLHLAIYYRNNLLQSLLVEARVMPGAGPDDGLAQLPGIGKARHAQLADAGIRTLADLAAADASRLAQITRAGKARSEAWTREATQLQQLGNRAFVAYTTSAYLTALRETPPRTVTILTNKLRGSHFVGVKMGEWDESLGQGDDYVYGNTLTDKEVEISLSAVRGTLSAISTSDLTKRYNFGTTNVGTNTGLARALYPLAVNGYKLYSRFFDADAQKELNSYLKQEKQTIHLARVVGNLVVPWAAVYDQSLDSADRDTDKVVCLHALEQLRLGAAPGCGVTGRPPGLTDQLKLALEKTVQIKDKARPGKADVNVFFYEDPTICPKNAHNANHVVCPWGFWGFKHYLEQPAQQLKSEEPQPRELCRTVYATPQPRVNVNVHTRLDYWDDHIRRLKALKPGGRSFLVLDAGEDKLDDQNKLRLGRAWVLDALKDDELAIIYFYCHGGSDGGSDEKSPEPFLSVGSSVTQRIQPETLDLKDSDENEIYRWTNSPLVFVNGCQTVALEPALFGNFVEKFAQHGAAGVIGTEVSVWEPLAKAVAESFLEQFLDGRPVGEILLDIRRDLLKKCNPLGLVYTNYCASDLRLIIP